jgi:hypothetical protein
VKLPNFLQSADLNELRTRMGAPLSNSFTDAAAPLRPIQLPEVQRELAEQGVDIDFDEVEILSDGTLGYKGFRVLLYIRDVADYGDREFLPKFHLSFCRTLETMQQNNRWERYVVANRDDGMFAVNISKGGASRATKLALSVCQNCLSRVAWEGFSYSDAKPRRLAAVKQFSLKSFFERYPKDLLSVRPSYTADTAPRNEYPPNWNAIAESIKRERHWVCEQCTLMLTGMDSRYLHLHHRNGQKNDCSRHNLEVLCLGCHANQPMHSHMKGSREYQEFAARFPT